MDGGICLLYSIIILIFFAIIWYIGKKDSLGPNKATTNAPPPNYGERGPSADQSDLEIGTSGSIDSRSDGENMEEKKAGYDTRDARSEKENIYCPGCGTELELDYVGKFCPQCGEDVSDLSSQIEVEKGTGEGEEKIEEEMNCPYCDESISLSEFQKFKPFCPHCGENITGGEEIEREPPVPEEAEESPAPEETEEKDGEERVAFEDEEKKRYKEKIDEWKQFGFEVDDLEELLVNDRMDEFKRLYQETKKQIEGE